MKDRETGGMTDDELDHALASLPCPSPAPDFADRIMARVAVPVGPVEVHRAAPLVPRRSFAVAASVAVVVAGSLVASVVWTLGHQSMVASIGGWFATLLGRWTLEGLQALVQAVLARHGSALLRGFSGSLGTLAGASALGSLLYLAGVLALRRLLTAPTQQVIHVQG